MHDRALSIHKLPYEPPCFKSCLYLLLSTTLKLFPFDMTGSHGASCVFVEVGLLEMAPLDRCLINYTGRCITLTEEL